MKKNKKYIISLIIIILFTFSMVSKSFQNDTFYIIELGNHIMENGVDWKDCYSIHPNLEYRYPHWMFDVLNASIYNIFNFQGLYVLTQVFASIFALIVFWSILRKKVNFELSFISTLVVVYMMKDSFCDRAQIVSFSIFLLEYILLELFFEKPTVLKIIGLAVLSCLMANIHSTAWIIMLILVLPFLGEKYVYNYSLVGLNKRLLIKAKKKLKKAIEKGASTEKLEKEIEHREEFLKNYQDTNVHKIIVEDNKNFKYIWIVIIALIIGALITPLKMTPFLYFLKTSLGNSMNYISEHLPIIPANNIEFLAYSIIIVALLGFTNSKLKLSDAFLILGLYLMTLSGLRNLFLLIGLTASIIVKMIDDFIKYYIKDENKKFLKWLFILTCIVAMGFSVYYYILKINQKFIDEKTYPVEAVKYIKENLDYKKIRMYNGYDYGSYMLMEGLPVFIDSRCDLYTPEFNKGVTVFDDYMNVAYLKNDLSELMDKYKLDYAILPVKKGDNSYIKHDNRYIELYKDKNFIIYKYVK